MRGSRRLLPFLVLLLLGFPAPKTDESNHWGCRVVDLTSAGLRHGRLATAIPAERAGKGAEALSILVRTALSAVCCCLTGAVC